MSRTVGFIQQGVCSIVLIAQGDGSKGDISGKFPDQHEGPTKINVYRSGCSLRTYASATFPDGDDADYVKWPRVQGLPDRERLAEKAGGE